MSGLRVEGVAEGIVLHEEADMRLIGIRQSPTTIQFRVERKVRRVSLLGREEWHEDDGDHLLFLMTCFAEAVFEAAEEEMEERDAEPDVSTG